MEKLLSVKNLNVKFGRIQILHNVNFDCYKGHIVGLIGPNGAGKTTIMKCILGLYPYNASTQITLANQNIKLKNTQNIGIGSLIENPAIYPFLTGMQHLVLYSKNGTNISSIIEDLEMEPYINKKAKGYSLGMKQKLGIAIALLDNPQLLILDEPMNGLDPLSTYSLRKLLIRLASQGITILISSHILSEMEKIIDDAIFIDSGKILLNVTMEELRHGLKHVLKLETNDNAKASQLLSKEFNTTASGNVLKIKDATSENLNDILRMIISHNIQIRSVETQENDLETTLLDILESEHRA